MSGCRKEGRLSTLEDVHDNTRPTTNVIPKLMTSMRWWTDISRSTKRLLCDKEIAARIRNKLRHLGAPVYGIGYSPGEAFSIVGRLVWKGILPGGPVRIWHFLRSIPYLRPEALSTQISDWITALSMRDFAERRLMPELHKHGPA